MIPINARKEPAQKLLTLHKKLDVFGDLCAKPARAKLTPYSAIFCGQVLAAQDFTHTPPLPLGGNRMKTNILDVGYEKIAKMPKSKKKRADAIKRPPRFLRIAES